MMAAVALTACGGSAATEESAAADDSPMLNANPAPEGPVSVRMEWGGGHCAGDCSVVVEVQSSGVLTLEDGRGAERFELAEHEYGSLWATLERADLLQALADASACHDVPGYMRSILVRWPSGTELADESVVTCTADNSHPYGAIYAELLALLARYSDCDEASGNLDRGLCRFQ